MCVCVCVCVSGFRVLVVLYIRNPQEKPLPSFGRSRLGLGADSTEDGWPKSPILKMGFDVAEPGPQISDPNGLGVVKEKPQEGVQLPSPHQSRPPTRGNLLIGGRNGCLILHEL